MGGVVTELEALTAARYRDPDDRTLALAWADLLDETAHEAGAASDPVADLVRAEVELVGVPWCGESAPSGIAGGARAKCRWCLLTRRVAHLKDRVFDRIVACGPCPCRGHGRPFCRQCDGTGDVGGLPHEVPLAGQTFGYPVPHRRTVEIRLGLLRTVRTRFNDVFSRSDMPCPTCHRSRRRGARTLCYDCGGVGWVRGPWGAATERVRVWCARHPALDRIEVADCREWFNCIDRPDGWVALTAVPPALAAGLALIGAETDPYVPSRQFIFATASAAAEAVARAVVAFARKDLTDNLLSPEEPKGAT